MTSGLPKPELSLCKIEWEGEIAGDFGLFTLRYHYQNQTDQTIDMVCRFVLVDDAILPDGMASVVKKKVAASPPTHYQAEKGEERRQNSPFLSSKKRVFSALLGELNPHEAATTELRLLLPVFKEQDDRRVVLPLPSEQCPVDVRLTCYGGGITGALCPGHHVVVQKSAKHDEITLNGANIDEDAVVIDLYSTPIPAQHATLFQQKRLVCCSFRPPDDACRRFPQDYHFVLDVPGFAQQEEFLQARTALLLCLRSLQQGDRVRLTIYDAQTLSFSDEFLPFDEQTLGSITQWLRAFEPSGAAPMPGRWKDEFAAGSGATVVPITDGQMLSEADVAPLLQGGADVICYPFLITGGADQTLLAKLAVGTGGELTVVPPHQRIDDAVVSGFSRIASEAMEGATVRFDVQTEAVTPPTLRRLYRDSVYHVFATCVNGLPTKLLLQTEEGEQYEVELCAPVPTEAGETLRLWHGVKLVQQLGLEGDVRQLAEAAQQYGLDGYAQQWLTGQPQLSAEVAALLSPTTPAHTEQEQTFIRLMQTQRANGSFPLAFAPHDKEQTFLNTANILYRCIATCPTCAMYRWQLIKATEFLLSVIEEGEYAVVPQPVLQALALWREVFGGDSKAAQKVDVFLFLQ